MTYYGLETEIGLTKHRPWKVTESYKKKVFV